jgi:hypothetical protein
MHCQFIRATCSNSVYYFELFVYHSYISFVFSSIRCMLLGHYLRGLEYRLELMELLSLTSNAENDASGSEQVA